MSNFVNLIITTNASKLRSKKRFPLDINVGQLKEKLVLVTGCDNRTMKIELFDKDDKSLGQLVGDDKPLWDFGVEDGMHIHITDLTTQDGAYDQTEEPAETFQLSTEEYAKRKGILITVIFYYYPFALMCEVRVPGQPTKRGVIEFIGQTKFKPGYWVGVRYDEPLGRNDGSIDGVRYFECPEKYGAFVKPQYVEAGDFPEFGIDDLDEI
ncbi:Tubulin-folding cofactor B [Schistosoma japonicum]|nr:Tubulin-folding cofactor B [Schistosoma japonicum]KAH8855405.1 Tubulin-folding cofactor B [Schistosoma japonicum]